MVRLKLIKQITNGLWYPEFQFLNGTIKANATKMIAIGFATFQFLNGTIKANNMLHPTRQAYRVSIPKWYD